MTTKNYLATTLIIVLVSLTGLPAAPSNGAVSLLIEFKKGYLLYTYNFTMPNAGTYIFQAPENMKILAGFSEEPGVTVNIQNSKIQVASDKPDFTFTLAVLPELKPGQNSLTAYMVFPLTPEGATGFFDVNVTVNTPVETLSVNGEYSARINGSRILLSASVGPGKTSWLNVTLNEFREGWPVVEQENRSIHVDSYSSALVVDEYEFVNMGTDKISKIVLELPKGAEVLEVEGPLYRYVEGSGAGRYTVDKGENSVSLVIAPVSQPGPGERLSVTVKYRVSVEKQGSEHVLPATFNPGLLVMSGIAKVSFEGSGEPVKPEPLGREGSAYIYGIIHVKEVAAPGLTAFRNVRIDEMGLMMRRIYPVLLLLIVTTACLTAAFYVTKHLGARVKPVKVAVTPLLRERLNLLREEAEIRRKLAEGKMSRRVFRQRIADVRSRLNENLKALRSVAEKSSKEALMIVEEFEMVEQRIREIHLRMERSSRKRRESLKREYEGNLARLEELIEEAADLEEG